MFSYWDRDLKALEKRLKEINARAIPLATRNVVNSLAFEAQRVAKNNAPLRFTLRNKFTVQSMRVDRAKGSNIATQQSEFGSIAPYMATQEWGGSKRGAGKSVDIPTSFSAGQGLNAAPRTRLPRGAYKMAKIQLQRSRARAYNRKQRVAVTIATSKGKFAFLDLGRRKGIFKIDKRGNPTMVHDLTRRSVRIPKTKWLRPATDVAVGRTGEFYRREIEAQLRRLGAL